jgi:PTS system mannose-specific IID component
MERLPRPVLARVMLRSFLLQASWNFERLQSLGFLYALAPALRRLYRREELAEAARRHLEYFNTHPFLAAPVIGCTLELEERRSRGEAEPVGAEAFKRMVMAPYAAIGDGLFWGAIRPLAAVAALALAFRGVLWAPLLFLLLFNLPHLWCRAAGLAQGYTRGVGVVEAVQRRRLPDVAVRLKQAMVLLLGGVCAGQVFSALRQAEASPLWGVTAVPLVLLLGGLSRRGVSPLLLTLAGAAVALAIVQIW